MIERRDAVVTELKTVRDYVRWACSRFNAAELHFGHGTDNAWDEALHLVLHTLFLPWETGQHVMDAALTHEERKHVVELVERRVRDRMPLAYLTNEAWFCGLPFYVDERVLVPRSPLGELIEQGFQPWLTSEPHRILDLCTGSGCIGIACAHAFPGAEVDLSDISADALDVARQNIEQHELSHRVRAVESDLFAGLQGQCYDLIVSNPPYVDADDLATMPAEFHAEPQLGLASGQDGLDFTRRLLHEAFSHLNDGGILICEVGNSWVALEAAFPQLPFTWLEFERGGHGVFMLRKEDLQALAGR